MNLKQFQGIADKYMVCFLSDLKFKDNSLVMGHNTHQQKFYCLPVSTEPSSVLVYFFL